MKVSVILLSLILIQVAPGAALWPLPVNISTPSSATPAVPLRLSPTFTIRHPDTKILTLEPGIARALKYIQDDGHRRLTPERGETDRYHLLSNLNLLEELVLVLDGPRNSLMEEVNRAYEDLRESYELEIPGDGGAAVITSTSTLGLLRGLQTFVQMVYSIPDTPFLLGTEATHQSIFTAPKSILYVQEAPILIKDSPAFPHRGFMLDTSRSFYSLEDLCRTLEVMSSVKLNVFHWHITDAQAWPLDLPSFPELAAHGAYSPDKVYTYENVREVQEFAASLGIRVILEVDMPGHTASIASSHPSHIACAFVENWKGLGNEPPTGQLKVWEKSVQEFAKDVTMDAAQLLKRSKYFSTGGDEINENCYLSFPDSPTQSELNSSLATFTDGLHSSLRSLNQTPIVWEEMVLTHKLPLEKSTIVMVWRSSSHAKSIVSAGYRLIHSPADYFYLDCGAGGWLGNAPRLESWCPFNTWARSYQFDPFDGLESSQKQQVLGGQALLWSEQSDSTNLDPIAWPRGAVAAEVFWTGQQRGNLSQALPRLHNWRYRAVQRGIRAIPLQPEWCALRPGACDL